MDTAVEKEREDAPRCDVCGHPMARGSGGKWLCKRCGFLLTCCDP